MPTPDSFAKLFPHFFPGHFPIHETAGLYRSFPRIWFPLDGRCAGDRHYEFQLTVLTFFLPFPKNLPGFSCPLFFSSRNECVCVFLTSLWNRPWPLDPTTLFSFSSLPDLRQSHYEYFALQSVDSALSSLHEPTVPGIGAPTRREPPPPLYEPIFFLPSRELLNYFPPAGQNYSLLSTFIFPSSAGASS